MEPEGPNVVLEIENRAVVGRLAPSPTGKLHVGHARTFLAAWLAARDAGGRIILRIEDLDATRARAEAVEAMLRDLRWLGIDWEEGPDVGGPQAPYIQSQRTELYSQALGFLIENERVYPCTCTRSQIERAASAPHAEDEPPLYPGTCARRSAADARALFGQPFAWRFRVPSRAVTWRDLVRSESSIDPSRRGGDFLVARSGGVFSYQLAVVVDDAAMGVTQVIRGDDLMDSTPRQLLLYRALGLEPPRFGHVPLVVGPDGRRLAKREGSCRIETLRERGVDAETLVAELLGSLRFGVHVGESEREGDSPDVRLGMEPTGRDRWNSDRLLLELNE